MSESLSNGIKWCLNNKRFFVFSFFCFCLFGFLIFPYNDLTSFVSDQVYNGSNKRVTLTASGLQLSIFPPGVKFTGDKETPLTIDSLDFPPSMPALELESLALAPSISSLLQFKKGIYAKLNGLFNGTASFQFQEGKPVAENSEMLQVKLGLSGNDLAIQELTKALALPVKLAGVADLDLTALVDPSFSGQPESTFDFEVENLRLNSFNYLGMSIPKMEFKTTRIKGQLKDGELILEDVQLGKKGDELFATIKGQIRTRLQKTNQGVQPFFTNYRINLDLTANRKFDSLLSFLDILFSDINNYKSQTPNGSRFNMALIGNGFRSPPRLAKPRR